MEYIASASQQASGVGWLGLSLLATIIFFATPRAKKQAAPKPKPSGGASKSYMGWLLLLGAIVVVSTAKGQHDLTSPSTPPSHKPAVTQTHRPATKQAPHQKTDPSNPSCSLICFHSKKN